MRRPFQLFTRTIFKFTACARLTSLSCTKKDSSFLALKIYESCEIYQGIYIVGKIFNFNVIKYKVEFQSHKHTATIIA